MIIISHNDEFTASLCTEKWLVENNRVTVTGSVVEGKELKTVSIKKNRSSGTIIKIELSISILMLDFVVSLGILEEKNRSNGDLQAATEIVPSLAPTSTGNTNKNIVYEELLNPKTLERLSKKEYRKLEKCAIVAGVTVKEYVSKIRSGSPEWAWL